MLSNMAVYYQDALELIEEFENDVAEDRARAKAKDKAPVVGSRMEAHMELLKVKCEKVPFHKKF